MTLRNEWTSLSHFSSTVTEKVHLKGEKTPGCGDILKVQRAREIGNWYNSYYEMRNFDFVPHFTLVNRRLRALSLE